jgi:hypothetical protein
LRDNPLIVELGHETIEERVLDLVKVQQHRNRNGHNDENEQRVDVAAVAITE